MKKTNLSEESFLSVSSLQCDLWEKFQQGDRDALGMIYRNHIDNLYHYGMHFCQNSEIVKDCLQELFQNLWQEREHLSINVSNIRYYLIISFRRRLLRELEKNRKNPLESIGDSFYFELVPSCEDLMIKDEVYVEKVRQLKEGISALSRRQREALYLRFYQNLSYSEISKLMSMKVDSVYNLISKAISLLKKMLLLVLLIEHLLIF